MTKKDSEPSDVVSMGPPIADGVQPFVRTQQVEGGVLIQGGIAKRVPKDYEPEEEQEVFHLKHLEGPHYEVTGTSRVGPAKVNSPAFRSGWDSIFGAKQAVGQA